MTESPFHRTGDRFTYVADDGQTFEGELGSDGAGVLTLVVRSIRVTGPERPVRLGAPRQKVVAENIRRILAAQEPGREIRVVDTPDPIVRRRPRRPRK